MTDQSRVEAVEQAIGDYIWTHRTIDPLKLAKAAIAANDAWLKADRRAKDKAVLKAEYPTTPRRPDK